MRRKFRELRRFQPSTHALEGRATVSSLTPAVASTPSHTLEVIGEDTNPEIDIFSSVLMSRADHVTALLSGRKKTTIRQRAKNQPKTEVPPEACPQVVFERCSPQMPACKPRTQPQDSPAF
jgi:hypothetical protein